jgi:hypothetical protein
MRDLHACRLDGQVRAKIGLMILEPGLDARGLGWRLQLELGEKIFSFPDSVVERFELS